MAKQKITCWCLRCGYEQQVDPWSVVGTDVIGTCEDCNHNYRVTIKKLAVESLKDWIKALEARVLLLEPTWESLLPVLKAVGPLMRIERQSPIPDRLRVAKWPK